MPRGDKSNTLRGHRVQSRRAQQEIYMDGVVRKHRTAIVVPLQHSDFQQRMNIAMHGTHVAIDPASDSQMASAPLPAIVLSNAQRLGVSVFQSSSSVAKEIRAPCFLPRHAAAVRCCTSLSEEIPIVMTRLTKDPYILERRRQPRVTRK